MPDSGFFIFKPKLGGFATDYCSVEAQQEAENQEATYRSIATCWQWRHRLTNAFSYSNKKECELERSLYLKLAFILNNKCPAGEAGKTAIKLLLSDNNYLFKAGDGNYRDSQRNRKWWSERKRSHREQWSPEYSHCCIEKALDFWFSMHRSETETLSVERERLSERQIARILLNAAISEAKSSRRSPLQWLYSAKHICSNSPDATGREYQAWDTPFLDIEKCRKDFARFLPEGVDAPTLSSDFYGKLLNCFAEYIAQTSFQAKTEYGSTDDIQRLNAELPAFAHRYDHLVNLERSAISAAKICVDYLQKIKVWEFISAKEYNTLDKSKMDMVDNAVIAVCAFLTKYSYRLQAYRIK